MTSRTKLITYVVGLTLSASSLALASPRQSLMNMMDANFVFLKQTTSLKCLGITEGQFEQALNAAKPACQAKVPADISHDQFEEYAQIYGDCVMDALKSELNLSENKINQCEQEEPAADDSLEYLADTINTALKMHAEYADPSEVPLPLYPGHKVISHFPDGMGQDSLPVIVIAIDEPIDKVIDFYASKVPNYKRFEMDDGIIYLESAGDTFDFLKDFKHYTKTPHVMIEDIRGEKYAQKEGMTKVEISYRK
ncbi:hypothetical protein D5018_11535 [Parashewanella curva]|uniref:Uncharacterized protein n=1 Tax=Parashewanella curva TaxID=2338552 RepID=A0A3L8PYM2_9GAMM|nr:hypothetical protein [Parashewanella curva]RLV59578.1 hypothetical protein D5018_11535 [Parashewanella curva]